MLLRGSWDDTFHLFFVDITEHSEGFTGGSLTICKDSTVITNQDIINSLSSYSIIDFSLNNSEIRRGWFTW